MAKFKCPSCKEETISRGEKFRMGWWATTHCRQCDARVAAFPWVLAIISGLHVWNVIWWTGLILFKDSLHYLIYMFIGWVAIELLNLYFNPLATLRKRPPKVQPQGEEGKG